MLVVNIGQLVTPQGSGPVAGAALRDLLVTQNAYVKAVNGRIISIGRMSRLTRSAREDGPVLDAQRGVVIPGLVDPHTHAVFMGTREREFLARCQGTPYGKGILTTVAEVRAASETELAQNSKGFLHQMLCGGTTTVEVKSGYGLDTENELKLLRVARRLASETALEIVPTFLGAHAVPDGVNKAEYISEIIGQMIPRVRHQKLAEFCDVFCEKGFFTAQESREILRAGQGAGLGLKIHADEFSACGGAELAGQLSAISADHLLQVTARGIRGLVRGRVVPVLLPGTAFTLNTDYAPARDMIAAGLPVALASDFNPGTCLILSMLTVIALAVMKMRMTAEEALTGATLNAAAALRRADRLGSIEVGKEADLVILELAHYGQIPYFFGHDVVKSVIKSGKLVYQREGNR